MKTTQDPKVISQRMHKDLRDFSSFRNVPIYKLASRIRMMEEQHDRIHQDLDEINDLIEIGRTLLESCDFGLSDDDAAFIALDVLRNLPELISERKRLIERHDRLLVMHDNASRIYFERMTMALLPERDYGSYQAIKL